MRAERVAASGSARERTPRRLVKVGAMEKLKRRGDFLAAAAGAKAPTAGFVLQERRRGDENAARVGFTVSKKVGGAVERNRVRRRLREIVRLTAARNLRPGSDYVLVGRSTALEMPFSRLVEDFAGALARLDKARRPADRSGQAAEKARLAGPQSTS
jgi:ribonuclease P protein component